MEASQGPRSVPDAEEGLAILIASLAESGLLSVARGADGSVSLTLSVEGIRAARQMAMRHGANSIVLLSALADASEGPH